MNHTIAEQYALYLQRIGQDEGRMHPEQKKQVKQAFYGAFGQSLIMLRDEISALPEDQGIQALDSMISEVGNFFLSLQNKQN